MLRAHSKLCLPHHNMDTVRHLPSQVGILVSLCISHHLNPQPHLTYLKANKMELPSLAELWDWENGCHSDARCQCGECDMVSLIKWHVMAATDCGHMLRKREQGRRKKGKKTITIAVEMSLRDDPSNCRGISKFTVEFCKVNKHNSQAPVDQSQIKSTITLLMRRGSVQSIHEPCLNHGPTSKQRIQQQNMHRRIRNAILHEIPGCGDLMG